MSITEKIKIIDYEIEKNKTPFDLDKETAKTSALSSGKVSKYNFLTGKGVLPEKKLQKKAAAIKRLNILC